MLQETVERISPLIPLARVLIVVGREHREQTGEQLPVLLPENILAEPVGRNTAPCICLAALQIARRDPAAVMVVLPADHFIADAPAFCRCLEAAAAIAQQHDCLVTIGVVPNRPETGYGYIQYANTIGSHKGIAVFQVHTFHEKPNREKAQALLQQGNVLWNSGMFVWKASTILEEIRTFLPDIYHHLLPVQDYLGTPDADKVLEQAYAAIEGISIDYGVMEKSKRVVTVRGDFGWNDVGSWSAVYDISRKDTQGNVIHGTAVAIDAKNNLIFAPDKLTAVIGLDDIVVVETADALLVCRKDQAQDVKKVVELLEKQGKRQYL